MLKNRLIWIAAIAICLVSAGASAMESNKVEEQIWAMEKAYIAHFAAGEMDKVETFYHDRFVGWPSHEASPVNREDGRASIEALLSGIEVISAEIEPRAITVLGDVVLAHYVVLLETSSGDAEPVRSKSRITHTWMKTPSGWKILGGMSSKENGEDK